MVHVGRPRRGPAKIAKCAPSCTKVVNGRGTVTCVNPLHVGYQSWGRSANTPRRRLRPASYVVRYARIAVSSEKIVETTRTHRTAAAGASIFNLSGWRSSVRRTRATAAIWDIVSVVSQRPLFEEPMRQKADLCEIAGAPSPRSTSTAW